MYRLRFILTTFIVTTCALVTVLAQEPAKKRLTAEQIFQNAEPRLTVPLPNISRWIDDTHYLQMIKKEGDERPMPYSVDAATGTSVPYKEPDLKEFQDIAGADFPLDDPVAQSDDRTRSIFKKDNDLYCLDAQRRTFKRLTENAAEEKNPTLSPTGAMLAFTRDNDLFAVDLESGKETRYTHDGSDVVYSGWAAWVYYEEIFGRPSRYRAFWWSPDGNKLAFYRFDETNVPMFPIYDAKGQHGTLERTRYPKSGDPNPEVRVGVVNIASGVTTWAAFDSKMDQYFGTPFWTPDGKTLLVQWMPRGQDTLILYGVNPATGSKSVVYAETQSSWIDWFESLEFLEDKSSFIHLSDKDGWAHLYLHSTAGKPVTRLTQGPWTVTNMINVNEEDGFVYFTARKEASTRTDLYRVKLNGKGLTRLTFGAFTHTINMSPKGSHFITSYSNTTTPTRMALVNNRGKVVRELGDSKAPAFDAYQITPTELTTIRTSDGYDLPVQITMPTDFDPAKKYPVLISVYGGPNSGTVFDGWRGIGNQWMAQEGLIQVAVDHRGSGHFGKKGIALMHRSLGKWEMNDYIEAAKWLRAKLFVDTTKIAITGGSYGGYVTCMALTYGSDYFTHGIALFSVTDWRLYDSHYTERYMDTPAENPDGYGFGSVLTHAAKYQGLLRIVHGTTDDNVHLQNSLQLVDALQNLNKRFELMLYPGERHGWGGAKALHLRSETNRFYYEYLLEKPFPEALFKSAMTRGGRR